MRNYLFYFFFLFHAFAWGQTAPANNQLDSLFGVAKGEISWGDSYNGEKILYQILPGYELKEDSFMISNCYLLLGYHQVYFGTQKKALEQFHHAKKLSTAFPDSIPFLKLTASLSTQIANINAGRGNLEVAKSNYLKALDIQRKIDSRRIQNPYLLSQQLLGKR